MDPSDMNTALSSPTGIYRPGYPFTGPELQTMTGHGVLRHMLADVYAERRLPATAQIRAAAASALLSRRLRSSGVLCGETAAWVHLGRCPPMRAAVITHGVYRRPTDGAWRIYQVRLEATDSQTTGRIQTTTPARTAADIYCGIGTTGSRRSLDQLIDNQGLADHLHYWPMVAEPLDERDHRIWDPAPADQQIIDHRMNLIGELMDYGQSVSKPVLEKVLGMLGIAEHCSPRAQRIAQLLDHCASRRLPTVR